MSFSLGASSSARPAKAAVVMMSLQSARSLSQIGRPRSCRELSVSRGRLHSVLGFLQSGPLCSVLKLRDFGLLPRALQGFTLHGLPEDAPRVLVVQLLLAQAVGRDLVHEAQVAAHVAHDDVGSLLAVLPGHTTRQHHDDLGDAPGIRYRRLSLPLAAEFEVCHRLTHFWVVV